MVSAGSIRRLGRGRHRRAVAALCLRQVSDADVALGDSSVAELMQTDAFQVLVKDPNFRKLANDPGFAALANNRAAMSAIAGNPGQFAALASDPTAFHNLVQQASRCQRHRKPILADMSALGVMAQNSRRLCTAVQERRSVRRDGRRSEGFRGAV